MKFKLKKYRRLISDITVCAVILLIFRLNLLAVTELGVQDALLKSPGLIYPDIIIIGIDDEAMQRFGPAHGWSRQLYADAISILNSGEGKPAVIALDILFTGESAEPEADTNLAQAAKNGGNVVVASLAVMGTDRTLNNVVKEHILPYPELRQYTAYGTVNTVFDRDNIIRNTMLSMRFEGEVIHSFASEVYSMYMGGFEDEPLPEGEVYINYSGRPGDYENYSFAELFDEDFDPDYFEDCIVFIGAYATGLMDAYHTPMSNEQMHGVEIHANTVQMLIYGDYKSYTPFWVNLLIVLVFVLAGLVTANLLDIRVAFVLFAALAAAYIACARLVLYERGYIPIIFYPVVALFVVYIYKLIYRYILNVIEKSKIKSAFQKYTDPKLVDKLIESGEADSNEVGVMKDIAVLFVDVRGFTPMTEALKDNPERVVEILNEYLELTSSSVFNNGGSVDKFIGDATMALFNGFVALNDYVYKAVKAAWDMLQGAAEVNAALKEKYGVDIGFGIGVHCGKAIVGNLGPSFRKDYTAIGDVVNTTARLESNAKRSEILISKDVYDLLKDRITAESIGEIPLKGKSIKLEVYSVREVKDV